MSETLAWYKAHLPHCRSRRQSNPRGWRERVVLRAAERPARLVAHGEAERRLERRRVLVRGRVRAALHFGLDVLGDDLEKHGERV